MIISVDRLKLLISTTESDQVLEGKLQALEHLIRKYTNNSFQQRNIRFYCDIYGSKLVLNTGFLHVGDTVQISESKYSDGVYHIVDDSDGFVLNKNVIDENKVLVTKVEYPDDVQMGVVNMIRWDIENRSKVGIQSETISRHSVTYFNMDGDNSILGYPKSLTGFLKPYMKARF